MAHADEGRRVEDAAARPDEPRPTEPRPPEGDWLGTPHLRLECHGVLAHVIVDRPERRNALTPAMYFGIRYAIDLVNADVEAPVLETEGAHQQRLAVGVPIDAVGPRYQRERCGIRAVGSDRPHRGLQELAGRLATDERDAITVGRPRWCAVVEEYAITSPSGDQSGSSSDCRPSTAAGPIRRYR